MSAPNKPRSVNIPVISLLEEIFAPTSWDPSRNRGAKPHCKSPSCEKCGKEQKKRPGELQMVVHKKDSPHNVPCLPCPSNSSTTDKCDLFPCGNSSHKSAKNNGQYLVWSHDKEGNEIKKRGRHWCCPRPNLFYNEDGKWVWEGDN